MEIAIASKPKTESKPVLLSTKENSREVPGEKIKDKDDSKSFLAKLLEKTDKLKIKRETPKETPEESKNVKDIDAFLKFSGLVKKKKADVSKDITPEIKIKDNKLVEVKNKKDIKPVKDEKLDQDNNQINLLVSTGLNDVKNLKPKKDTNDGDVKVENLNQDKKLDISPENLKNPRIDGKENLVNTEISKNIKIETDKKDLRETKNNRESIEPKKKDEATKEATKEATRDVPKFAVSDIRDKKNQINQDIVKKENLVKEVSDVEIKEQKIILGTTEIRGEGDGAKAQAPVAKEAIPVLKQQLADFGNNEIVKQSRYILKDNNIGEIKLILKPESLGEVKINLNLKENSLAGQIIVENNSVKELFQQNLQDLSKALVDSGFDSAKLDISLGDKGQSNQGKRENSKQFFSERLKKFEESGQVIRYGLPTAGINLTA